MKERSVTHGTFVIERNFPATPERVFDAFADPVKKRRWFSEEEESGAGEFKMDFRAGGAERKTFASKQGVVFTNHTIYQDILPNRHIVFVYTMSMGDKRFSSSQATVEFLPDGKGTHLIFTEQGAYLEGADGPEMRKGGWQILIEQLARTLEA
jgi:uncharacterized protein YndB with AHSA1/START domain